MARLIPEWTSSQLESLVNPLPLRRLFADDVHRFEHFSIKHGPILFDYSHQRIDASINKALLCVAEQRGLASSIESLFSGALVNKSEQRAALHPALRESKSLLASRGDLGRNIIAMRQKMEFLLNSILNEQLLGYSGKAFTDVINVGIGGSDLGPRLVSEALQPYHQPKLNVHFLSNLDGSAVDSLLRRLDPQTTLCCVVSKSFTTDETLRNANCVRRWLIESNSGTQAGVNGHFIAVTSQAEKAIEFGINQSRVLPMWDWVGGRYSLWSAVGFVVAAAIGLEHFMQLLAGAEEMDQHFKSAPFHSNMPVVSALVGIWNRNYLNFSSQAVIAYDERLASLTEYLQQLEMESNGKSVDVNGHEIAHATVPIVWGGVGSNAQHAFFQALHQGTDIVPVDFIACVRAHHPYEEHHRALLANLLGQVSALAFGQTEQELRAKLNLKGLARNDALLAQRFFSGNRPSSTLMLESLTPRSLGGLLAFYEHKVFVQSIIWGVNAFDQWGVELGKDVSKDIYRRLGSSDTSEQGMLAFIKQRLRA